jgi:serine protease
MLVTRAWVTALATLFAVTVLAAPEDRKVNLSAISANQSYHRIIVQFEAQTRSNAQSVGNTVNAVARGQGVGLQVRRQLAVGAHVIEADQRLPAAATEALLRAFARKAEVEYAEPDALMQPNFTPNDAFYGVQWHYSDPVSGMNLPAAWDVADGSGEVVAVLDTGQTDHVDLAANLVAGYDFISDTFVSRDGDLRDADPNDEGDWTQSNDCGFGSPARNSSWHGTHVAGTIAAVTDNSIGVAGVAFGAQVQHVRVLGRCGGYLSDIADGIIWASGGNVSGAPVNTTPASVINMSLGGGGSCGSTYQNAINQAVSNGATVVVSAGNSDVDASNARPANCNNVITVAASGQTGARAGYSNYGSLVEITAPGGDFNVGNGVASTLNDGTTIQGGDIYVYYQGTSMAAPHISGLVAMMMQVDPTLTPAAVSQTIQDNARPMPVSCPLGCGAGLADAEATLLALGNEPPPPPANLPPAANFSFSCVELACQFNVSSSVDDGSITSRLWNFGDGNTSTAINQSHTYASGGAYDVTLAVTDDDGATDSITKTADPTDPAPPPPGDEPPAAPTNLTANTVTQGRGRNKTVVGVDLSWTDNAINEAGFEIESCVESGRGRNKQCNFALQATVGPDVESWSDGNPESGTHYRVRAVNEAGASAYSNEVKVN